MNLTHMKHALEVAKAGPLSKASETLLIAAPNISRSNKELETNLGCLVAPVDLKLVILVEPLIVVSADR